MPGMLELVERSRDCVRSRGESHGRGVFRLDLDGDRDDRSIVEGGDGRRRRRLSAIAPGRRLRAVARQAAGPGWPPDGRAAPRGFGRPDDPFWIFLGSGHFAAKRPDPGGWISLDSLVRIETYQWVKREKRRKNFPIAFPRRVESGRNGGAWSRTCESAGLSRSKPNLIFGLLEDIVVQAVSFGRVCATHLTASESRRCRAPGASWLRRLSRRAYP